MRFGYLFALTDDGGTLPPELGVVRRLVQRGHQVRVIADASAVEPAARTGAEMLALQSTTAGSEPGYVAYRDWEIKYPWRLSGQRVRLTAQEAHEETMKLAAMLYRDLRALLEARSRVPDVLATRL